MRVKEQGEHAVAKLIVALCGRDRLRLGRDRRRDARASRRRGQVVTIANGSDFDDFAGLEHTASERFRITHTGIVLRQARPAAVPHRAQRERARHQSRGSSATSARPTASGRSSSRLGDRLELIPYAPRRRSLELQRDSEALLLLIPEAGGRGKGVLSGKVFEYLAAERPILALVPPDGAAAELIREAGAGVVVAPEDVEGIAAALREPARALAGRRARRRRRSRRSGGAGSRGARASRSSRGSLERLA